MTEAWKGSLISVIVASFCAWEGAVGRHSGVKRALVGMVIVEVGLRTMRPPDGRVKGVHC
jgi:hypothetical protein